LKGKGSKEAANLVWSEIKKTRRRKEKSVETISPMEKRESKSSISLMNLGKKDEDGESGIQREDHLAADQCRGLKCLVNGETRRHRNHVREQLLAGNMGGRARELRK